MTSKQSRANIYKKKKITSLKHIAEHRGNKLPVCVQDRNISFVFLLYVWSHSYKCLSSDFSTIIVCLWCYTCKKVCILTCRMLCMGHLTSTWSNQSSLGRVCRNHWHTTEDWAYCVNRRSAQFFIRSFSLAWTRVSSKNDVPEIQLKYSIYKQLRTRLFNFIPSY